MGNAPHSAPLEGTPSIVRARSTDRYESGPGNDTQTVSAPWERLHGLAHNVVKGCDCDGRF